MKKFKHILLAVCLLAISGVSSAIPINGGIMFIGSAEVDFDGAEIFNISTFVVGATGDFGTTIGQFAFYNDFEYEPFVGPISPLWKVGGFSFALHDITHDNGIDGVNVDLKGTGMFSSADPDLDDTYGTWSFSGAVANDINGPASTLAIDSARLLFFSDGTAVPEPTILGLLGLGLIGLGVARKTQLRE